MKNIILKGISYFMAFMFAFGGCSLDSDNLIVPYAMVIISATWLILFYIANRDREEVK